MADYYTLSDDELGEIMVDASTYYEIILKGQSLKLSNKSKFGSVSSDCRKEGNIYIAKSKLSLNRNVKLTWSTIPLITLSFYLKGHSNHNLDCNNYNAHDFKQGYSSVWFMNEGCQAENKYEKNLVSEITSFNLTLDYFAELTELYPDILTSYNSRLINGETFLLNDSTIPITLEMYRILGQLNQADFLGKAKGMYFDAKVIELLSLFFAYKNVTLNCLDNINLSDKEAIVEARRLLIADFGNTPSLKELSTEIGINERKLKEGFKKVYGNTVFGYLFEYKMNLAKQYLLDSSNNINEIAY